jgi:hypothetical protein
VPYSLLIEGSLKIFSVAVAYASDIFDVRNSENAKRKNRQTMPALIFFIIRVIYRLLRKPMLRSVMAPDFERPFVAGSCRSVYDSCRPEADLVIYG